jgi:hypothetical protein
MWDRDKRREYLVTEARLRQLKALPLDESLRIIDTEAKRCHAFFDRWADFMTTEVLDNPKPGNVWPMTDPVTWWRCSMCSGQRVTAPGESVTEAHDLHLLASDCDGVALLVTPTGRPLAKSRTQRPPLGGMVQE